jgi:hypothetical protein
MTGFNPARFGSTVGKEIKQIFKALKAKNEGFIILFSVNSSIH